MEKLINVVMLSLHSNYEGYSEVGVLAKYAFALYFMSDFLQSELHSSERVGQEITGRGYTVHSDSVFSFGCMYAASVILTVAYGIPFKHVFFGLMLVATATKHYSDTVNGFVQKLVMMILLFGLMIFDTPLLVTVHFYFVLWILFSFKAKAVEIKPGYLYNLVLCTYITLQKNLWALF